MSTDYTILVSTCDAYEDAWYPFFRLLATYWPECGQRIVLTTEEKDFSFDGLNIDCAKIGKGFRERSVPWGERMIRSLRYADSRVVLVLLEDFFLCGEVDVRQIESLVDVMLEKGCAHIGLTRYTGAGPFHPTDDPLLWEVDREAEYRINLQAGLWDPTQLLGHLRPRESAWDLEVWGSIRARRVNDCIMCVNKDWLRSREHSAIVPYVPSGIRHGRWERNVVVELFRSHGIDMDYSKKGFTEDLNDDAPPRENRVTAGRVLRYAKYRFDRLVYPLVRYSHLR